MRRHPPGPSWLDGGQRVSDLTDHARDAGDRLAPLGSDSEPYEKDGDAGQPEHDWQDESQAQLQLGHRGIHQDHRTEEETREAAGRQQAVAGDLDFKHQQQQTEEHQQQAGVIDREDLEGEERQQEAESSGDAGQHRAGTPQFDRQPERAQGQENEGDLGMGDGAEHTLAQGHLDRDHLRASGLQHNRRAVEPGDGSPIQPSQQLGDTGDHEIDERWRGVERLLLGKGAAVVHRLLRERDVPMTLVGEGARIRGHVGCRFLRHGLVHRLAGAPHRMRRADVRARRHGSHVGGDREEEAGRRGASAGGPDKDRDGRLAGEHVRDDVARGIHEAARRAEGEDDERRARAVGAVHGLDHVIGGDRMDDAVDFGRVDDGRGCGRVGLRGHHSGGRDNRQGTGEPPNEPSSHIREERVLDRFDYGSTRARPDAPTRARPRLRHHSPARPRPFPRCP